ncbi:hypothetical protein K435DRAFT_710318 [Dendrothele bispora CBS 962.96]|uniref:Dbl homology domain-containing protein n=1 Tax=Dendrothele bispora (strain CBS 962.96) TaxID=1314807 RepID=A0A4S8MVW3_DENBC|nr:hypothetical protein K435DRAFT_710318 [Dendrothele bispora CBS 962.96]
MHDPHNGYHPHRPQVVIPHSPLPPGAQQPQNPSPSARPFTPWAFEVSPPSYPNQPSQPYPTLRNPWGDEDSPTTPGRNRTHSMVNLPSSRTHSRSTSLAPASTTPIAFPQPQVYRATSAKAISSSSNLHPSYSVGHRPTKSEVPQNDGLRYHADPSSTSLLSDTSSYYQDDDYHGSQESDDLSQDVDSISDELSNISLAGEEGIRLFQSGQLPEKEQEWHKLVPPEAIEALGKTEVQRQSVIFEVFKAEREYVADLEAVQDVFITPLRKASPPIIRPNILPGFITEVFGNFGQILSHHQRMLGALFDRQREQHPLIQSIADIVLDTTLKQDFRTGYEIYIKHYPLAESHHRKELKTNPAYQGFIHSASNDPRIRKRDLITFLSRPVTRLPRLNLLLEQILKLTDKDHDHPDTETLPIILGILSDCIKGTQPGIEAAESKVKFWGLCESLVYQKGEIIDMDLYDKSRTLVYSGTVYRRNRPENSVTGWSSWTELSAALMDNYFLLTREETRPNGVLKRHLMSRPLSLAYLRLGSFKAPPETRKESQKGGSVLGALLHTTITVYPFTIYHAANKLTRRYTLYVSSEAVRTKWYNALVDALAVYKAKQEGNMYFAPNLSLSDRFFRVASPKMGPESKLTGRIISAVPFASGGHNFIAATTPTGVYVSIKGRDEFRRVLSYRNARSIAAMQTVGNKHFNKFVISVESTLLAYSLDLLARVALGDAQPKLLDASMEHVVGKDANVVLARHLQIGQRMLIIYASKRLFQSSLCLQVLEATDISVSAPAPSKRDTSAAKSFKPFGDPGYVPKDAYDVAPLVKTIGICAREGIIVVDPMNLTNSRITVVPDFSGASSNTPMNNLKNRLENAKALGLVRSSAEELLVIFDTMGTYITKHGIPTRQSGFIKWEAQAHSYASRGAYLLLFSPQFIEVRHIMTGRLVQVIEGEDIRLLYGGPTPASTDNILVVMRGNRDDENGLSEKIVELMETSEINDYNTPTTANPAMWDEWDM